MVKTVNFMLHIVYRNFFQKSPRSSSMFLVPITSPFLPSKVNHYPDFLQVSLLFYHLSVYTKASQCHLACLFLIWCIFLKFLLIHRCSLHPFIFPIMYLAKNPGHLTYTVPHTHAADQHVPVSSVLPASWQLEPETCSDIGPTPWQDGKWCHAVSTGGTRLSFCDVSGYGCSMLISIYALGL